MHPILVAGLICGCMDITAALTVYGSMGIKPMRLLQGISSGLLGPAAFQGGVPTAALGLLCHYVVALGAAAVFYLASRKLRFLTEHAVAAGVLYAAVVYFFMQNVVLPLSRAAPRPFVLRGMIIGLVIHVFCVGLPISLAIRRFSAPVQLV
jgi:hypothetical protein